MSTPNDGQPTYAAGWYADVNAPGTERWYDGKAWTQHVRAVGPEAALSGAAIAARTSPTTEGQTAAHAAPAQASSPAAGSRFVDGATAPVMNETAARRPWYKRKGIVIPVGVLAAIIVVSAIGGALGGGKDDEVPAAGAEKDDTDVAEVLVEDEQPVMVAVPNVVGMVGSEAQSALTSIGFDVDLGGGDMTMPVTAQSVASETQAEEGSTIVLTLQEKPKLTLGQQNAIDSAQSYLSFSAFSRSGLSRQLTSEYGEGFDPADAEFAMVYLEQNGLVDWNAQAAKSAQSYLDMTSFSRQGLYDQLTSEYGEGFTPEQANAGLAAVGY